MKNHYTLNPGEFFAAQELIKQRKDVTLAFPLKDAGWDLLAIKTNGKVVRLQVKESRAYPDGRTWHQVKEGKLDDADVFIFARYVPVESGGRLRFNTEFMVIPQVDLKEMCAQKVCSKGKYSFYFKKYGQTAFEERETGKQIDVTRFFGAWEMI